MESISSGVQKTIKFERKCVCPDCRGTRALKGTVPSKCYACGGTGTLFLRSKSSALESISESICTECDGYGKVAKRKCTTCEGIGFKN